MGESKRRKKLDPNWGQSQGFNPDPQITARKIFVIGGSTYNEKTLEKIRQALIDSKFLDEWAVIIAIHKYLRLNDQQYSLTSFENKIKSELSSSNFNPKISLITKPGQIIVETGSIYVLPDPGMNINNRYVETSFMDDNAQLKICAERSTTFLEESKQWFLNNQFDASGIKRIMTAKDFLSFAPEKLPLINASNLSQLRVKASRVSPTKVLYQDMPCIDKLMSEVAASKSQPKIAALLLCGLHGDGANGLKEIKNNGGDTAVQLPDECCHQTRINTSSMPKTALEIEPNHQRVTLEDKPDYLKLSDWLSSIK